jgi:hypothetical protein
MKSKIKENLKAAYQEFLDGFSSTANKEAIEERLGHPIGTLFENQKRCDWAKRNLKSEFGQALKVYFAEFDPMDVASRAKLERALESGGKVFNRHLDKSSLNYLKLILALSGSLEERPKGLLSEYAS